MKTNIKELSRFLRESLVNENKALNEARMMFLTECKRQLDEEVDGAAEIYKNTGGFNGYEGITPEEYQKIYRELHQEYWPELDPVNQPYVPRGDVKKSTEFYAELDSRLNKAQASKGVEASDQQKIKTQQLAADVEYSNKSWTAKFWDGLKDSLGEKWDWVKKYAKTAGIVALVLGAVFLVIYGIRQTIEMIRTIRKTKRESRDGTQVIMTIPFENEEQMEKFFKVVRRKMSDYVEVESIDGNNVTISCDQEYVLKHISEIKATIKDLKVEQKKVDDKKLAAESNVSRTMTFSQLKRLVKEDQNFKTKRELTRDEKIDVKRFVFDWMNDCVIDGDEDANELVKNNKEHSCIETMVQSEWFDDKGIDYDELDYDKLADFVHVQMKIWAHRNA